MILIFKIDRYAAHVLFSARTVRPGQIRNSQIEK
jgi:hypothetical protein